MCSMCGRVAPQALLHDGSCSQVPGLQTFFSSPQVISLPEPLSSIDPWHDMPWPIALLLPNLGPTLLHPSAPSVHKQSSLYNAAQQCKKRSTTDFVCMQGETDMRVIKKKNVSYSTNNLSLTMLIRQSLFLHTRRQTF